jgi:hypothetical protein
MADHPRSPPPRPPPSRGSERAEKFSPLMGEGLGGGGFGVSRRYTTRTCMPRQERAMMSRCVIVGHDEAGGATDARKARLRHGPGLLSLVTDCCSPSSAMAGGAWVALEPRRRRVHRALKLSVRPYAMLAWSKREGHDSAHLNSG